MMIHPITDEILEQLWCLREDGKAARTISDLGLHSDDREIEHGLDELVASRAIRRGETIDLLQPGDERARGIVRRQRLAEILFNEVLEVDLPDAEASACEFEHMLSERVVDRVCTFLGHPPKCPHGKPIPQGSCCHKFEKKVDPLIMRLYDLPIAATGKIVFIAPKSATRLNRLATLGVIPGTDVRLLQRKPSIVIGCGETSIALEEEIAYEIYVRPERSVAAR